MSKEQELYRSRFLQHGLNSKGCGYQHGNQHAIYRYTKILEMIQVNNETSVLDVGCGTGIGFQVMSGMVDYYGIDRVPEYIDALQKAYPEYAARFIHKDFGTVKEEYDWIVFSGVFSLNMDKDNCSYEDYVSLMLRRAFNKARKGIVFNGIGSDVDFRSPDTHYFDVLQWHKRLRTWGNVSALIYPKAGLTPFEFYFAVRK